MLVLTHKTDEQILIGEDIKITLVRVRGNSVRLGIEAPRDIRVVRGELDDSKRDEVEFELSDREQVFAHPQAKIISGRIKVDGERATAPAPKASEGKASATTPAIPHATLRRVHKPGDGRRAPLASFVSAT